MLNTSMSHTVTIHPNAKHLLDDILNGSNRWLYNALAQLNGGGDGSGMKINLGRALKDYLDTLYRLQRHYGFTTKTYTKFYHHDGSAITSSMLYLLNTLCTYCKTAEDYNGAVIALWIALERKEGDYNNYALGVTGQKKDGSRVPVNSFLLREFVRSPHSQHA